MSEYKGDPIVKYGSFIVSLISLAGCGFGIYFGVSLSLAHYTILSACCFSISAGLLVTAIASLLEGFRL